MSIFDRFKKRKEPQDLLGPNSATSQTSIGALAMGGSNAGIFIDDERALSVGPVYAAVSRIARDLASLPLHLYETDGRKRTLATWRPEYRLLNSRPNNYQSAYHLRESLIASCLLWGNGYAEIERNIEGRPIGLHFIEPGRVSIRLQPQTRAIEYHIAGGQVLTQNDVFHIKALSTDGVSGRSIVRQAREAIGLTVAAERYGASYFGNGATPGGVLETEKRLTDPDAVARLRETWNSRHQGPNRAGGVAVLEDGMTYRQIGIPPEDSQFLETRQFQIEDVARWFGLPPAMLGVVENTSQYKNLHEQVMFYTTFTLRPWLESIESDMDVQLIPDALQGTLYFEHNLDALNRADVETRYRTYETGLINGWLSVNEIRQRENMDPIDGGDTYRGMNDE